MSYHERRVAVSLISTLFVAAIYFVNVLQRFPQGSAYSVDVFHFWGASMFILVPVSIVVKIVVEVVFNVAHFTATKEKEKETRFIDERDKLIQLRGLRNALFVFVFGFTLAMGSLVLDQPPSIMFMILFTSGFVSGMFGDISQLYLYRRGF